jgi:hypothetical protein
MEELNLIAQKSLIELFDYNWQLKHTEQRHLFHYTSVTALKNILETKELWASKSDFLNDYSEINYIIEIFNKVYDYVASNFNTEIVGFFELVKNDLANYFQRKFNGNEFSSIFIVSMSENQDSLVLWSNYSKIDGYNICFDTAQLMDVVINHREENKIYDTVHVGKIIYNEEEQIKILFNEIMRIYKMFREHSRFDIETINQAVVLCQVAVETYSMFFKKSAFEQEDEFRIAFIITDQEKLKRNIKYRIDNGSLIPYISIPLEWPVHPFFGVTIGPKNNTDTSVIGLRHFLKYKGFPDFSNNVFKSMIPLRF